MPRLCPTATHTLLQSTRYSCCMKDTWEGCWRAPTVSLGPSPPLCLAGLRSLRCSCFCLGEGAPSVRWSCKNHRSEELRPCRCTSGAEGGAQNAEARSPPPRSRRPGDVFVVKTKKTVCFLMGRRPSEVAAPSLSPVPMPLSSRCRNNFFLGGGASCAVNSGQERHVRWAAASEVREAPHSSGGTASCDVHVSVRRSWALTERDVGPPLGRTGRGVWWVRGGCSEGLCHCRVIYMKERGQAPAPSTLSRNGVASRAVLKKPIIVLLRTASRDHQPPAANRHQLQTTTNHQPSAANRQPPPTTNRRQPPTANRQLPTTTNQQPPTANL